MDTTGSACTEDLIQSDQELTELGKSFQKSIEYLTNEKVENFEPSIGKLQCKESALEDSSKEMLEKARQEFAGLETVSIISLNHDELVGYFTQYSLLKDLIGSLDDFLIKYHKLK
ncbi:MAG: hypothetical protein QG670_669 [Thermoproteota archaeon]|nr:hypothetical protein [Thermoproteota archaeon]